MLRAAVRARRGGELRGGVGGGEPAGVRRPKAKTRRTHPHDARLRRGGYGHGERGNGSVWSGRTSVSTVHAKKTALIEERAVETTLGGSAVRPRLCTVCDRVIRCACRSSTCAHACSAILNKPPSVHPTRSTLFERRANSTVLFSIGQSLASLLHSVPSQPCDAVKLALKTTAGRHLRTLGPACSAFKTFASGVFEPRGQKETPQKLMVCPLWVSGAAEVRLHNSLHSPNAVPYCAAEVGHLLGCWPTD